MNPLTFIQTPDWRSGLIAAGLAALFALPWLVALARGELRRWPLWAAVVAGAVIFPISIGWVQVPIQQGLNVLWARGLDTAAIQRWLLAVAVPSIAVSGLVQESAKLLVTALGLRLRKGERTPRAGLALGAAAGAGFGALEAYWIFNVIFASGFTWATVQLTGPVALLGFVERFITVPFHIAVAALAGYGLAGGRRWRLLPLLLLLLAAGLHSLANYSAVMLQAGLLGSLGAEVWLAAIAIATVAAALVLQWLPLRPGVETTPPQVT